MVLDPVPDRGSSTSAYLERGVLSRFPSHALAVAGVISDQASTSAFALGCPRRDQRKRGWVIVTAATRRVRQACD